MSSSSANPWVHHRVAVFAAARATYGRTTAAAAASPNELWSTDRRVTTPIAPSRSGLCDRVLREDLLAAFESLVDCRFRCHPIVYYIVHRDGEHVLGADLRPRRVVHLIRRDRRTVDALPGIGLERLILWIEPERLVVLDDRRHRRQPAAEPALQKGGGPFRHDRVFKEFLRHRDVF